MRYMMLVMCGEGQTPSQALMDAMGPQMEKELTSGGMVDTGGLAPSSKGARVKLAGGKLMVIDGPFTETKEVIGGYAIYDVPDHEAAMQKAMEFMEMHRTLSPGWEGYCEVRPMAFSASEGAGPHPS
jgi:hypothetical protein